MAIPEPDEVRAQLERVNKYGRFRGAKQPHLVGFLVERWIVDGGKGLTLKFIAETLQDEPLTFKKRF
jgi:hypothetical protein